MTDLKSRMPSYLYASPRFGMLVEEMAQRHEQFLRMLYAASIESLVNIVDDHGPDGFSAMGLQFSCSPLLISSSCQKALITRSNCGVCFTLNNGHSQLLAARL
jgi:hypothetical protein